MSFEYPAWIRWNGKQIRKLRSTMGTPGWILENLSNHHTYVLRDRTVIKNVRFEGNNPILVRMTSNGKKKILVNGECITKLKYLFNGDQIVIESETFLLRRQNKETLFAPQKTNPALNNDTTSESECSLEVCLIRPQKIPNWLQAQIKVETKRASQK